MKTTSVLWTLPVRLAISNPGRYHLASQSRRFISINSGINEGLRDSIKQDSRQSHRYERKLDRNSRTGQLRGDRPRDSRRPIVSASDDPLLARGVPHTTAASTFIFGKRNVTAALTARRRQLYKLYLRNPKFDRLQDEGAKGIDYGEEDDYSSLKLLARSHSVPCYSTSRQGIRQVKNSILTGRQLHDTADDGVCLEASTLPHLALNHLGPYSRGESSFDFELAPQSTEDAEINGINTRAKYANSNWRAPFLIWLHGVVDAGNVGAIIRSALYFGADGIILSSRGTASMTAGVLKSSAGAAEFMPLYKVSDYVGFTVKSQANGWVFYAAVPLESSTYRSSRTKSRNPASPTIMDGSEQSPVANSPTVLVMGNEELGLPLPFMRQMQHAVSIPMGSALAKLADVDSLNVSVAAALLCEKFLTRPNKHARPEVDHRRQPEKQQLEEAQRRAEALF